MRDRLRLQIYSLKAKHDRVITGFNMWFNGAMQDELKNKLLKLLAKDGFRINKKTEPEQEKKRILRQLEALKAKIKLKESELKQISPESDKKEPFDVDKELFLLEQVIDSKYKLKASETTVKEYAIRVAHANNISKKNNHGG
jgi:hypothetical protein